jgi:dihydrofolate synthase/folylpolyglutamate synthase
MTPRDRLFALEQFGIKLGLDNITTLVAALGRPDHAYPSVHVGGTNGKGSVTAMVERGLRAAGHRTGRYTSPHLSRIEERIAIDGRPVSASEFDAVTSEVLSVADELIAGGQLPHPPTFFEATTAIAFEVFKRERVTAAVIEVGLGGRFDATNVIAPAVTAITSIDLDHQRQLGTTLGQIAFEKAGIIKRHIPLVVGPLPAEAYRVIAGAAQDSEAPLIQAAPSERGEPVTLALNGDHQRANAAVAVEILRLCRFMPTVAREHLVTALTDVEWPARLEWLRVPGRGDLLLDAAHNPAGARALSAYVTATVGRLPLVLSIMRDKDVEAIVRELVPAAVRVVATMATTPRALPSRDLARRIEALTSTPCAWHDDVNDALMAAWGADHRVMVAGSIFLVGPLRAALCAGGAQQVRYPSKASPFFLS